jgi:hypothetical protein
MFSQRTAATLTLIIADSAKLLTEPNFKAQVPSLARLAGRGAAREIEMTRAQRAWTAAEFSILEQCGLLDTFERFPSGAVVAAAMKTPCVARVMEDSAPDQVCWAHAQAVHFSAGLSDLAGLQLRDHALVTDEEHIALSESLRSHLGADCELHALRAGHWLLEFPRLLHAQTQAPQHAFRGPLQEALPSGPNGAELRRLMTELQMIVHDDAVNQARARRGLPAINAVWIWGLGAMPRVQDGVAPDGRVQGGRKLLPKAYGSSAFLNGLYLLHGTAVQAGASTLDAMLNERRLTQALLAVIDDTEPAALQARWFGPLERALRTGRVDTVAIHFDRWRISLRRVDLLRLWRAHWNPPEQSA